MSVTSPGVVLHYRRRADNFLRSAVDLETLDRDSYAPTIGLLSVHACIALADALLVAAEGPRANAEDHGEAARRLQALCSAKHFGNTGVKHFEWLLSMKNHFSYDASVVKDDVCWMAKLKMDQFFVWASRTFPEVAQIPEVNDA